jgi:hypothetical protein
MRKMVTAEQMEREEKRLEGLQQRFRDAQWEICSEPSAAEATVAVLMDIRSQLKHMNLLLTEMRDWTQSCCGHVSRIREFIGDLKHQNARDLEIIRNSTVRHGVVVSEVGHAQVELMKELVAYTKKKVRKHDRKKGVFRQKRKARSRRRPAGRQGRHAGRTT